MTLFKARDLPSSRQDLHCAPQLRNKAASTGSSSLPPHTHTELPMRTGSIHKTACREYPTLESDDHSAKRTSSDRAGCVQVNVLNYLQSIISGQATANPVMDSPITALIVQMLRAPQQGAFQVLLATILGLLVRHCTFIPADLAQCGELPPPSSLLIHMAPHLRAEWTDMIVLAS